MLIQQAISGVHGRFPLIAVVVFRVFRALLMRKVAHKHAPDEAH